MIAVHTILFKNNLLIRFDNKSIINGRVTHRRKTGQTSVAVTLLPVETADAPEVGNSGVTSHFTVLIDA
jgi:hypothetical protein